MEPAPRSPHKTQEELIDAFQPESGRVSCKSQSSGSNSMTITLRDGEPCKHRGCERHSTHPCEVCGRTNAHGEITMLKATYESR